MYIDPNTGGILFQVLAVIITLFSGVLLVFSSRIKAAVARVRRAARNDETEIQTEPVPADETDRDRNSDLH